MSDSNPKPERRLYQFKVRTLLIVVAAVALICADGPILGKFMES